MDDMDVTMRFMGAIHMVAFGELRLSGHIYRFTKYQARHLMKEYPGLFEIVSGTLEEPPAEEQVGEEQSTEAQLAEEEPPAEAEDDPQPNDIVVEVDEPADPAPEPVAVPKDVLTVQGADGTVLLRVTEPEPEDKGATGIALDEMQPQPLPVPEKPKSTRRAPRKRQPAKKAAGSD